MMSWIVGVVRRCGLLVDETKEDGAILLNQLQSRYYNIHGKKMVHVCDYQITISRVVHFFSGVTEFNKKHDKG